MKTYQLGIRDRQQYIECLICKMQSFNSRDIEELYCGYCHAFHNSDLKIEKGQEIHIWFQGKFHVFKNWEEARKKGFYLY